jgi:hypothetical protein
MLFHKNILSKLAGFGAIVVSVNLCYADDGANKVEFNGSAIIQSGQMVNYKFKPAGWTLSNQWVQDNILTMGFRTRFHPRVEGNLSLMGWLFYNTFPDSLVAVPQRSSKGTAISFSILNAQATLHLSPDPSDSLLEVHVGIFPYKYNRDVRNLGEYLFRTGCYPGYIVSDGFDMAGSQVSGIRVSNNLFGNWRNELFLTTELYLYPLNDFSLTYLTDITPFKNKILNVGAAVQLFRCFSVDKGCTQPKYYAQYPAQPGMAGIAAPNYYFAKDDPSRSDTLWYTFAGTKIMARFSFDPKPLLGIDMFGPEDLKLYSEAIILGVKNYPANFEQNMLSNNKPFNEFGYDKLMEKMPIMVGLNLPVMKILDVFSVEAEYYGKKYVNRIPVITQSALMMRLPVPYDPNLYEGEPEGGAPSNSSGEYTKETYRSGAAQWKWSVYAKKTLFTNFSIIAQAARDHKRVQTPLVETMDPEEALIKDKQWYWMLKFAYNF